MGSGSLAAMSVFEHGYKDGLTEQEAKKLVQEAILAGVWNDLGSGSNVDVTIIKRVNGVVEVVHDINSIKPNNVADLRAQIRRDVVTNIPRGATRTCTSCHANHRGLIGCVGINIRRAELQVRALPACRRSCHANGTVSKGLTRLTVPSRDGGEYGR
jgi:hypothetical protein